MSSEGTPLHGDRSAWNVMDFDTEHAKDIMDSTLRRHLPLPGATGGLTRSDGTDWQRVNSLALADIAGYVRGYIIRGGASDWEAYDASTSGFILVGDGTDIASVCFDWDTMAGGAGADMVHTHASAGEGGQISHDSALTGVSADDHHSETHVINSTGPHAETGLTIGHVLRATEAEAFSFGAIAAGDLPTAIDAANIADGSVSNAEFQYLDDYATIGLVALTAGEVDQLENIDLTTISAAQWGYLGALDQGLATGNSPTFAGLTLSGLGAGAVQSDAGGVISSGPLSLTNLASYARGSIIRGGAADWEALAHPGAAGRALVSDGADIVWDVTPTWLGGHTFMQGMSLLGNTGINIITIKGNVAKGMHIVDNVIGGACEYVTFVTTTGSEEVVFNELGYDLDFRVEAVGHTDALQVRGSDGQITLGALGAGFVQSTAAGILSSAAIVAGDLPAHTHAGAGQGSNLVVGTTDTDATLGSVLFAGTAGVIQQDNANFFWDNTIKCLGLGTAAPDIRSKLHVAGGITVTGNYAFVPAVAGLALDYHLTDTVARISVSDGAGGWTTNLALQPYGGNVGIGRTVPQGKLHGFDAISGFMHREYDGVDGTARTILLNGAGDVLYKLMGISAVRRSDGTTQSKDLGSTDNHLEPGSGTEALFDDGVGNVLSISVAADGSIVVQRTADDGSAYTYKVGLWLLWL